MLLRIYAIVEEGADRVYVQTSFPVWYVKPVDRRAEVLAIDVKVPDIRLPDRALEGRIIASLSGKGLPEQPMRLQVDLDTSTYRCPCGSNITWSGINDGLRPWLITHAPHTNGQVEEIITADGCRATGGAPTTRTIASHCYGQMCIHMPDMQCACICVQCVAAKRKSRP